MIVDSWCTFGDDTRSVKDSIRPKVFCVQYETASGLVWSWQLELLPYFCIIVYKLLIGTDNIA